MKTTLLILSGLFLSLIPSWAQTPTACFEIESILVDACGNPEGENEMVQFHVGPAPLNVSNLTVTWPNNGWLGICQDATTAGKVAQLNATIVNCGWLLEPTGGILPAGSRVILISSTNFNVSANSFAGLSDTLYVIFQCQGNTAGHFANATSNGLRTLTMSFSSPAGCTDAVTYSCQSLVDINGNTGLGGTTADRDGSTVEFDWGGTASYTNDGCNAPFQPQLVDAGQGGTVCQGDTVQLQGTLTGSFSSFGWSGGTGTYLNGSTLTPQYVVGAGDSGPIAIVLTASDCNGSLTDTVFINVNSGGAAVTITPPGPVSLCGVDSVQLTASGSGPFLWNTGPTTSSIYVSAPGTYIVTVNSSCGSASDTVVVSNSGLPPVAQITPAGPLSLCAGQTLNLTASGGGDYVWNTTETTATITISATGIYSVIVSDSCGSDTAFVTVTAGTIPVAVIDQGTDSTICAGQTITLSASGGTSYEWSTGDLTNSIQASAAGNYFVVVSNACGSDTAFFTLSLSTVTAQFTADPYSGQVPLLVQFDNTSINGNTYGWVFGDGGTSVLEEPLYQFESPGQFIVVLTAVNPDGCIDTVSAIITVDSCEYTLFIPNTFTPNGDGVNDEYFLQGNCVRFVNVYIYNRWGMEVYSWSNMAEVWNGQSYTDAAVPEGSYVYVIDTEDYNGVKYHYSAMIVLLR